MTTETTETPAATGAQGPPGATVETSEIIYVSADDFAYDARLPLALADYDLPLITASAANSGVVTISTTYRGGGGAADAAWLPLPITLSTGTNTVTLAYAYWPGGFRLIVNGSTDEAVRVGVDVWSDDQFRVTVIKPATVEAPTVSPATE